MNHRGGEDYCFQATIHNLTVMFLWSHSGGSQVLVPPGRNHQNLYFTDVCASSSVLWREIKHLCGGVQEDLIIYLI